jgi:hypothetical protein
MQKLLFWETILKFSWDISNKKGHDVHCFQGIQTEKLHHQVENNYIKAVCSKVMVIHAGTNNIRHGRSATEIMRDTMDLIY